MNAATYQNANALARQVTYYVDQMAAYQGQTTAWGNVAISRAQITARSVDLVIPATGATSDQLAVLYQLQVYAQSLEVALNIVRMP